MEESVIDLAELIDSLVDGSQVFQYYSMCIFGCLIILSVLFVLALLLSIPIGLAKKNYIRKYRSYTKLAIYEYENINIFNCWKWIKFKKGKKNGSTNSKN